LGAVTLSDMTHLALGAPPRDVRVTVRVPPELATRIDALASHCGQGRSQFIRTSVAFADAAMVLAELRAVEARGPLSPEASQAKQLARRRFAEIGKSLEPKPLLL